MSSPSLSPKLLARFYEVLVLLRVLGQVQGDKIPGQALQDDDYQCIKTVEMRRKVLRNLCIICDFQKGGETVTAIAAEDLPSGPRYWLAANGKLSKIRKFLSEVLVLLERRSHSTEQEARSSQCSFSNELFAKIRSFQRSRVKEYWNSLQESIAKELARISRTPTHQEGADYKQWLGTFHGPNEELSDFLQVCETSYAERLSPFLRVEYDPIMRQRVFEENSSRTEIRHYIGRLSTLKRASEILTYASCEYPVMFQDFSLREVPSQGRSNHPPARQKLNLDGITGRMFSGDSSELNEFRDDLQTMDKAGNIMTRILEHYANGNWRPNTHAELAVLEAMHLDQCSFYDNDKYIACSKAACFCCWHYISSHPGGFVHPKGHNKVYLNWKPPSLPPASQGHRALQQRDIMNELIKQVRKAAVEMVTRQSARKWHPDSSTGITPSVALVPESRSTSNSTPGSPVFEAGNGGSADDGLILEVSEIEDDEDGGVALP